MDSFDFLLIDKDGGNGHHAADSMPAPARVDFGRLQYLGREVLLAIGEDPDRPGLKDTPKRWAKWWREFIEYEPGKIDTVFKEARLDQMVVIRGMRIWSICEHHLLPFWSDVTIGYIARDHVLGLSKFARIAHAAAHKPQIQERLVDEIALEVVRLTQSDDVAVLAKGQHLCMLMRGIKTPGDMITSVTKGIFREDYRARAEFLKLATD